MRGFLLGRVWAMRPFQEAAPRDPSESRVSPDLPRDGGPLFGPTPPAGCKAGAGGARRTKEIDESRLWYRRRVTPLYTSCAAVDLFGFPLALDACLPCRRGDRGPVVSERA